MPRRLSQAEVLEVLWKCRWQPVEGWVYVDSKTPIPGSCGTEGCGYEDLDGGPRLNGLPSGQGACPRCAGKERITHAAAIAICQARNWKPIDGWVYRNNKAPIPGTCTVPGCGYEDFERGPSLKAVRRRSGCRRCTGQEKLLQEEAIEVCLEHNWLPVEGWKYHNSNTPIPGRCTVEGCGYENSEGGPRIAQLRQGSGACPRCSGVERIEHEDAWAYCLEQNWLPVEGWKYHNSNTPIPGRCTVEGCGYENSEGGPRLSSLKRGGGSCPRCSGKEPHSHEHVFALCLERNWLPVEGWFYQGALQPIPGRCTVEGCGYENLQGGPQYHHLRRGVGACVRCGGREPYSHSEALSICYEKKWEPVDGWEYINNKLPIPGRCTADGCGYENLKRGPSLHSLLSGQGACPSCSPGGGFDPSEEGWLYLLSHERWGLLKVGITNVPDRRLATHQRNGWSIIEVRGPMPGSLAVLLERQAIESLKRRGGIFGQPGASEKFDGHTESWTKSSFEVDSLKRLMEIIYEDD
jgi:hypothetical protein